MAERVIVSPGVFSREIDGTFAPASPQGIGPVIISARAKGPGMVPVLVKDIDEDQAMFGAPDSNGKDFGAYTARAHLRQLTTPATIVRLLGMSDTGVIPGYSIGKFYAIGASGSHVVALIQVSGTETLSLAGTLTSSVSSLAINISNRPGGHVTASLNRGDSNYIKKVLNTDPTKFASEKHVIYAVYDYANKVPASNNAFFASQIQADLCTNWQEEFLTASTTTIISQPFDNTEYSLFGVGTIPAGEAANTQVKVSIRNIRRSPNESVYEFGSFDLLVRDFFDNDRNPVVLETFGNCNLDPNSRNFVLRRVGTRYRVWNKTTKKFDTVGDYENKSKFIYLTPHTDLANGNVPATAVPYGFSGYTKLLSGAAAHKAEFPGLPLVSNMVYKNDFTNKVFWGIEVTDNASGSVKYGVPDKIKHLAKTLTSVSGTTENKFSLKWLSASVSNVAGFAYTSRLTEAGILALSNSIIYNTGTVSPVPSASVGYLTLQNIENTPLAKFTLPVVDGWDGVDDRKVNPFDPSDMASALTYQAYACRTAVDMVSNPEVVDMSELVIPGVWAVKVTDYALEKIEDRADAFYIMDVSGSSVDDVISDVTTRNVDSNYAGVYYPWVKLHDEVNNKDVEVPPTVVVPAAFAYSDRVSFPWFAPAGLNRGGLKRLGVTEAKDKLLKTERDRLYDARINPLATMTQEGVVIFGQKTLQIQESALTRINVRRMLLRLRKTIARIGARMLFEPNVAKTWERFENQINPILEQVRINSGLDDFKVILDERTTTEDLIERNLMYGKIAIKPTRAAEYILLDFFVTNNVAGFAE